MISTLIRRFGARLAKISRSVTPDPFVLAIGLTAVTALLALSLTPAGPLDVVAAWQGGLWSLLSFAMQMCLVLVTGHALASAPLVRKLLDKLVERPRTARGGAALVAFVAIATSLLNWGLGLIVGALLAQKMGVSLRARGIRAHYPVLAASGYTGLMTWHGGFSGSAPLKVTTQADLLELLGPGISAALTPVSTYETILGGMNLFVSGGLLLLVPLVAALLMPAEDDVETLEIDRFVPEQPPDVDEGDDLTLSDKLERSWLITALLVIPMAAATLVYFRDNGLGKLTPNSVNLTLMLIGLVLHGHPRSYVRAIERAVTGCAGIILQFPLYAGIMGIMKATGLAKIFATWAVGLGSGTAYTIVTFFIAGLINLFVPSGGGQWAVQGPIAAQAATELSVPLSTAVMAVAYGDQWTNMLQPFWALPLLGITGVKARDIIGYTAAIMLLAGGWFIAGLVLFG